jgi:hypothetical protein
MRMIGRRGFLGSVALAGTLSTLLIAVPQFRAAEPFQQGLPTRISDEAFWQMIVDFSEKGGTFVSENFSSNERGYQTLIPKLLANVNPGGVYMGVGPEQNFQYIAALRPKMAFIVDIRRQNMIQHLMYKAAFEMSSDRAEFLSRIFSRKRPESLNEMSTVQELFDAYRDVPFSSELAEANLRAMKDLLIEKHKFGLTTEDQWVMEHVVTVFALYGPYLSYNSNIGGGIQRGNNSPTYADIMVLVDQDGVNRSYLSSEESFQFLKDIQERNLIVPIVGDFGGPKAIRAVGNYVKEHDATVMAFYLSNVEQYLFQGRTVNGGSENFYRSVATLPLDGSSTFIRSGNSALNTGRGGGLTPLMSSMLEVLQAFSAGRITKHQDVINMSIP